MTSRFYTNDGGLALSAETLNSLEADVDKGLAAFSAISSMTLNSWQPDTSYTVGRYLLNPDGLVVKVLSTHKSGIAYDSSKFSIPASGPSTPSNLALSPDGVPYVLPGANDVIVYQADDGNYYFAATIK